MSEIFFFKQVGGDHVLPEQPERRRRRPQHRLHHRRQRRVHPLRRPLRHVHQLPLSQTSKEIQKRSGLRIR